MNVTWPRQGVGVLDARGETDTRFYPPLVVGCVDAGSANGTPVLLTPGFSGQDVVYWNVFRRRLEREGFPVFAISFPGLGLQDIHESAGLLEARVHAVKEATGAEHVHLVGHSLGGLVMRTFVQTMGGDEEVGVCATLGTPHHGTVTALAALVRPACRQMLPGSAFLEGLGEAPLEVPFVNVYASRDSLVVPYGNARLERAENFRLRFGGHWGLLLRKAAYRPVVSRLRRFDPNA